MSHPILKQTVTHNVRAFLSSEGVWVSPWTKLDKTYEALYKLLKRKKDDTKFWPRLRKLLDHVVRDAVAGPGPGRLPAPQAELLSESDLDSLVSTLRLALSQNAGQTVSNFVKGLNGPVLTCFLVLGISATGCYHATNNSSDSSDTGTNTNISDTATETVTATETETDTFPEWAKDCNLEPETTLWKTIDESTDTWAKQYLCSCFSDWLSQDWQSGLTELFENENPETIAAVLEEMVECCGSGETDSPFEDVKDQILDGSLCYPPLPYKGVSFPDK